MLKFNLGMKVRLEGEPARVVQPNLYNNGHNGMKLKHGKLVMLLALGLRSRFTNLAKKISHIVPCKVIETTVYVRTTKAKIG